MDLAQDDPDTIYLDEDEAWMYLQATVMAVWNPVGETPIVRVDPGRSKVAFYGSLDLQTGEELVTRTSRLDAVTTAQFTAQAFTTFLETCGIQISMDGRGRAFDNIFVERLWRSVKYEDLYLKEYATVPALQHGLRTYFELYNHECPHQSLAYQTPADVHEFVKVPVFD